MSVIVPDVVALVGARRRIGPVGERKSGILPSSAEASMLRDSTCRGGRPALRKSDKIRARPDVSAVVKQLLSPSESRVALDLGCPGCATQGTQKTSAPSTERLPLSVSFLAKCLGCCQSSHCGTCVV